MNEELTEACVNALESFELVKQVSGISLKALVVMCIDFNCSQVLSVNANCSWYVVSLF